MPNTPAEAKLDILLESILFLVRHSPVPNLADALVADLHRTFGNEPAHRPVVDALARQLRERDELIAEDDA